MKRLGVYLIIFGILIGLIIGISISGRRAPAPAVSVSKKEGIEAKKVEVKGELDIQNAFIKVADEVGKAVVAVSTEKTQKVGVQKPPFQFRRFGRRFSDEDPFEKFFEDFFNQFQEKEFKQQGIGSGFIIDKKGHILTNNHVIEGADKINVTLPDGRSFAATVKGADPRSDLAVIKVEAGTLPTVELGDSNKIQIGEWVVALGNPFGNIIKSPKPTITAGVISALHRRIPAPGGKSGYLDLIQTDAAINPGNSGGPLCDLDGKVIGINVAIFSTSGGYQGIGFAIPVNILKEILDDLTRGKEIAYGWLGVSVQEITPEMAEYFNLPDRKGALVSDIFADSSAEKAGLKEGDIIRAFNGKEISDVYDLLKEVANTKVGEKVRMDIIRDRVKKTVEAVIGKRPSRIDAVEGKPFGLPQEAEEWRGIRIADITDAIARSLNLKDTRGVVIVEIERDSPSMEAGLRKGDVIKEINRARIQNSSDYKRVTKEAKGSALVRTTRGYFIVKEK